MFCRYGMIYGYEKVLDLASGNKEKLRSGIGYLNLLTVPAKRSMTFRTDS